MPVSTLPLTDVLAVFESKLEEVKKLLAPGRQRKIEALAAARLVPTPRTTNTDVASNQLRGTGAHFVR